MFSKYLTKYVGPLVRHGLTAVGGALVAVGIAEPDVQVFVDAAVPVVTGAVSIGVGIVLSVVEKKARDVF